MNLDLANYQYSLHEVCSFADCAINVFSASCIQVARVCMLMHQPCRENRCPDNRNYEGQHTIVTSSEYTGRWACNFLGQKWEHPPSCSGAAELPYASDVNHQHAPSAHTCHVCLQMSMRQWNVLMTRNLACMANEQRRSRMGDAPTSAQGRCRPACLAASDPWRLWQPCTASHTP